MNVTPTPISATPRPFLLMLGNGVDVIEYCLCLGVSSRTAIAAVPIGAEVLDAPQPPQLISKHRERRSEQHVTDREGREPVADH